MEPFPEFSYQLQMFSTLHSVVLLLPSRTAIKTVAGKETEKIKSYTQKALKCTKLETVCEGEAFFHCFLPPLSCCLVLFYLKHSDK